MRIIPRQRITKYHERSYWKDAAMVFVVLLVFGVGMAVGMVL